MRSTINSFAPLARDEQGFTLLEVIIAMTIMLISFAAILSVESGAINASARAKQLNIVAMLARNKMVETEYKFEGKTFDEFKKEDGGTFEAPYTDYRWTYKVKEIKFPNLNVGGGNQGGGNQGGSSGGGGGNQGGTDIADMITKLLTKFLTKAMREVTVNIYYKRGSGEQSFSVSTYWVNLNQEFETSE